MKRIAIIFMMALTIFSGCSDFLEEENKSYITAEEFYITSAGYNSLITSNYTMLGQIFGQDPWLFMAGTDMYMEGRNAEPVGLSQYTELNSQSEGISFLYSLCYQAIQRANTAIYYADITEKTDMVDRYVAEVRFLRALSYFMLVQTYGGVPMVEDYYDGKELVFEFAGASAEKIYSYIISEMEAVLPVLAVSNKDGRVNSRAVQHYLALVYLTRAYESFAASDDFEKAATYADEAIAGQPLDIPFDQLWKPGNERNAEVLFSAQYSQASISTDPQNLGNQQQNFFGPYLGGNEVNGKAPYKSYTLCPTRHAIDLFEEGDERWDATFMVEVYTPYYAYFRESDLSEIPVAHFYEPKWFDATDSINYRLEHPDAEYHSYGTYDPEGGNVSLDYSTIIVKKFDDPNSIYAGDGGRTSARDFIMARLGETYLIAAEAYLGAGDAGTGLLRLNEVRRRSGMPEALISDFNINYILDERGRELLGEYKRWFDLKRTGKLVERASAYNPLIEQSNFSGNGGELKTLRPIPQDALDLNRNDSFQQNPAYK
ncbi:RagB/SusD family nutrient uptake outer membrane protein [Fulvivirga sediminis]|uniref:RagB/SusD family nutrient uptake outer membrane protein n=1 Tax=Fulvivirga sediminis TaxID=2803949 RepID=A0A937F4B4_9BACT|nr:RagB/SusD family nutrient uptake outer membrane protein [Fulvivirga sediminis]MBL3656117.1 RagB/SusD family nutrient uptake outer membrane protein [Fulvivirga sediminis]